MKKLMIALSVFGITQYITAQQNVVTKYPEEIYQYSGNGELSGSARYRGLSGAMGALGGDMSATMVNPAGAAVFLTSEFGLTGGVNSSKIKTPDGGNFKNSEVNLDQAGGVLVFNNLNSSKWKNVSIGMNYQKTARIEEDFNMALNSVASYDRNLVATRYLTNEIGESSLTNVNVAANYNDKIYMGIGVNIHSFNIDRLGDHLFESNIIDPNNVEVLDYYKDQSKWYRSGVGTSISLGVIAKVNQQLRLGLAYESPTWYSEIDEGLVYFDSNDKDYYWGYAVNDKTTSQKVTASGAFVIGKNGFISADYTFTDYSPAKFSPSGDFRSENDYINNNLKSTSTIRVGGEARLDNFKLRAGYRYEQSPFEDVRFNGDTYKPFGDLNGFSLGAGYDFGGLYLDASYDFFKRDRSVLVSGNYYNFDTQNNTIYAIDSNEAGYEQVVDNITEHKGNFALTLGFRF